MKEDTIFKFGFVLFLKEWPLAVGMEVYNQPFNHSGGWHLENSGKFSKFIRIILAVSHFIYISHSRFIVSHSVVRSLNTATSFTSTQLGNRLLNVILLSSLLNSVAVRLD